MDTHPTRPRILAVDDEAAILALLRDKLESEGFEVLTASSAREFADLDAREDVDVYLIDVTLRDGNGFSLVKELRKRTDKGIIILTGRTEETDHVLGLELGADDYVTKPFRLRELAARVGAVLRRTAGRRGAQGPEIEDGQTEYRFDGYSLSIATRTLHGPDGEEIPLTTAEFNLLAALLRRRGQVLDRDALMTALKGRRWESYDRAVDGLVSRLRRKIGNSNGSPYIRTVHGTGYIFSA